jgi:manganese transport protein
MAGQIVMEGFLDIKLPPWLRRLITRVVAIAPAAIITVLYGESGAGKLLIFSQVVLSLQLPFAVVPLILIASNRGKMGDLRAPGWLIAGASVIAAVIIALNIKLILDFIGVAG